MQSWRQIQDTGETGPVSWAGKASGCPEAGKHRGSASEDNHRTCPCKVTGMLVPTVNEPRNVTSAPSGPHVLIVDKWGRFLASTAPKQQTRRRQSRRHAGRMYHLSCCAGGGHSSSD